MQMLDQTTPAANLLTASGEPPGGPTSNVAAISFALTLPLEDGPDTHPISLVLPIKLSLITLPPRAPAPSPLCSLTLVIGLCYGFL